MSNTVLWGTPATPHYDGNLQQSPNRGTEDRERRELIKLGVVPAQKVPVSIPRSEEQKNPLPLLSRSEPIATPKRPKRVYEPSQDWLRQKPDVDDKPHSFSVLEEIKSLFLVNEYFFPQVHYDNEVKLTLDQMIAATPNSEKEALSCPQKQFWLKSMIREKTSHCGNETFGDSKENSTEELKPTPTSWVFKIKWNGPPTSFKDLPESAFKTRIILKGQYMKQGIHYNDSFSPTPRAISLRAMCAVAAKFKWFLGTSNVRTAYLIPKLVQPFPVKLPPLFDLIEENFEYESNKKYPVKTSYALKGLPGAPHSGKLWYDHMRQAQNNGLCTYWIRPMCLC